MSKSNQAHSQEYVRFGISQRLEHGIFLVSFSLLGFTGLIQKFAESPISLFFIELMGGVETTRIIHHWSAIVMMLVSVYHVLVLLYKILVLRVPWTMMPWLDDLKHVLQDVAYYLGIRKQRAQYGHFTYAEKAEYLAVVWGTVLMGATGFMMWNPISTARFLPGEFIPAAKAAHGAEAILAVLAILLWHFYHVHLKTFNKSMFTGKLNREQMEHEHPVVLQQIESGAGPKPIPAETLKKRQMIYYPLAAVILVSFSFGLYAFIGYENTSITTVPRGETVEVYVRVTPVPRPTATMAPSPTPGAGVSSNSWDGSFEGLFRNRCSTCHGTTKVGGLTLAKYKDALAGGKTGPGIVPGEADKSVLVQVQQQGGHPGQLTEEELQSVIDWINAGAPEK